MVIIFVLISLQIRDGDSGIVTEFVEDDVIAPDIQEGHGKGWYVAVIISSGMPGKRAPCLE